LILFSRSKTLAINNTTIGLEISYIVLMILQWIFLFLPYTDYDNFYFCLNLCFCIVFRDTIFLLTLGGTIIFFGLLFLIPSFILNIISFVSIKNTILGKVGFILGVFGWYLGLFGVISTFMDPRYQPISVYIPLVSAIFTICLIIFGSLLFFKFYKTYKAKGKPKIKY
jgi:hypothetical protein